MIYRVVIEFWVFEVVYRLARQGSADHSARKAKSLGLHTAALGSSLTVPTADVHCAAEWSKGYKDRTAVPILAGSGHVKEPVLTARAKEAVNGSRDSEIFRFYNYLTVNDTLYEHWNLNSTDSTILVGLRLDLHEEVAVVAVSRG